MVRISAGKDFKLGQSSIESARRQAVFRKVLQSEAAREVKLDKVREIVKPLEQIIKLHKLRSSKGMAPLPSGKIPSETASSCTQFLIESFLSVAGKWATAHFPSNEHSLISRRSSPDMLTSNSGSLRLRALEGKSCSGKCFSRRQLER
ncbi:protein Wnt-8a [Striga asiatica]|uniref:Protein Wnt-8a n=1 Tax=Striga asiatica TaxID=4170 RepID=A0A5A7QJX8_STRAF|nr:protein Wnt-8a [Striga asiatica]